MKPFARFAVFPALLLSMTVAQARDCDVDADGDIDRDDVAAVFAARGQAASGPSDPRDPDRSMVIAINDARICALRLSGNTPPVANAGSDRGANVGERVVLDGSASTDVDG